MKIRYKELREDHDLKQSDVAKILGVTTNAYRHYENFNSDMTLTKCNALANYYHVSVDYLLGLTDNKYYQSHSKEVNYDLIKKRITELRKQSNLTQATIASKLGFVTSTYGFYETGRNIPTTLKLLIIANYHQCSMDYLMGRIDNSMIKKKTKIKTMTSSNKPHVMIKELRKSKKLTQENIANILEVKLTTYRQWELRVNDLPLNIANTLANYYHVSLDYLLGLTKTKQYDHYNLDINYNIMCTRLKQLRKKQNLKQTELCLKLNMPQTTYSDLEHGKNIPTTFKLLNILSYYNASMDYILGRTDINNLN